MPQILYLHKKANSWASSLPNVDGYESNDFVILAEAGQKTSFLRISVEKLHTGEVSAMQIRTVNYNKPIDQLKELWLVDHAFNEISSADFTTNAVFALASGQTIFSNFLASIQPWRPP